MKTRILKIAALVLAMTLIISAAAITSSADIEIKPQDNHYLNDAKDISIYRLVEDEDGKIRCQLVNLYESELDLRAMPVAKYQILQLIDLGVGKTTAAELTVGEYQDYIYGLPMDKEYIPLLEHYGVSPEEYAEWTNMDAENYLYDRSPMTASDFDEEPPYTDELLEKVNAIGITLDQFKSLMNMSYELDEITAMTPDEVKLIFGI